MLCQVSRARDPEPTAGRPRPPSRSELPGYVVNRAARLFGRALTQRLAPLGLSTGLLAAFAAYGDAASGLGGGGSIATRLVADILAADIASGSDTTPDTAVSGRRTPRQPAAVVTATIRIARTASQSVRGRPRAYIRQRRSQTDSMLSAPPPRARPAGTSLVSR